MLSEKSDLKKFSALELLKLHSGILDEMIRRGIVRTHNIPTSDYAEWLVSKLFKLDLAPNSKSGYDGIDENGKRYQIKSRRLTKGGGSRQLGIIRNLHKTEFDYLVVVIFDELYRVKEAYYLPHALIKRFSFFSAHQHGHILQMRGDILRHDKVRNITSMLKKFEK